MAHHDIDSISNGKFVAATIGMFDGVHLGHRKVISMLKDIAAKHDMDSAIISFNNHPQIVLNPKSDLKLIMTLADRLEEIRNLGIKNHIILDFDKKIASLSARDFLQKLHDDYNVRILLIGYNHHFGRNDGEDFEDYIRYGEKIGIEITRAEEYTGQYFPVSSSIIRKLILTGKVDDAARCMANNFKIKGTVVHGLRNGRKIGFPTANIEPLSDKQIIPHNGVYAVKIAIESGIFRNAVCNIGVRPTIDSKNTKISIEVNIFDFNENIYGKKVTVEFIKFIRSEVKFHSIEELKNHIETDKKNSCEILDNNK